jgi:hypothetical protein
VDENKIKIRANVNAIESKIKTIQRINKRKIDPLKRLKKKRLINP